MQGCCVRFGDYSNSQHVESSCIGAAVQTVYLIWPKHEISKITTKELTGKAPNNQITIENKKTNNNKGKTTTNQQQKWCVLPLYLQVWAPTSSTTTTTTTSGAALAFDIVMFHQYQTSWTHVSPGCHWRSLIFHPTPVLNSLAISYMEFATIRVDSPIRATDRIPLICTNFRTVVHWLASGKGWKTERVMTCQEQY